MLGSLKGTGCRDVPRTKIEDIDLGFKRIFKALLKEKKFEVLAGVVGGRGEKGVQGEKGATKPMTVAQIAATQEFGTTPGVSPRIPSRPFLRRPFDAKKDKLERIVLKEARRSDDGLSGVKSGLTLSAEGYATLVRKAILARRYKELSQVTVDRRRRGEKGEEDDLPLFDTGQMFAAIGTRVIGEEAHYEDGARGKAKKSKRVRKAKKKVRKKKAKPKRKKVRKKKAKPKKKARPKKRKTLKKTRKKSKTSRRSVRGRKGKRVVRRSSGRSRKR